MISFFGVLLGLVLINTILLFLSLDGLGKSSKDKA